jgi:hypothetical protein
VAVAISTAIASFWAIWGAAETFHEGWYYRSVWRNIGLSIVQYFPAMLVSMGAGLLAVWRPGAGVVVHLAGAAVAFWLFRHMPVGMNLVVWPLLVLAAAYGYGRPAPRAWARRLLVGAPLLVALVTGAYPAWRVMTRPDDVDTSMRLIPGNGVSLVWAPMGPGWGNSASWYAATNNCARLTADGTTLAATPQGVWRLPTADEAVRTMAYRGRNADGRWDPATSRATYRRQPDKEAPLWDPFSPVIYLWTSDTRGSDRAYFISHDGGVTARPRTTHALYHGYRCVRAARRFYVPGQRFVA